jgi:diaminopimelate decarboxylase
MNSSKITDQTISKVAEAALRDNLLSDRNPAAVFFDLWKYEEQLRELSGAFPTGTLHAIALKANPVVSILRIAAEKGFGAECASMGELLIAKKAGFESRTIVYDSPTKTIDEIRYALDENIFLNIDNEQELNRVYQLISNGQSFKAGTIGLRINPGLAPEDFNHAFSENEKKTVTGLKSSKFGVLIDQAEKILSSNPQFKDIITGLHVHIGSQYCPIEMVVAGIKKIVQMAEVLNERNGYHISTIDIGGGLPVQYRDSDRAIGFEKFSAILHSEIPELFHYKIITEFGRAVFANSGWVISKVEYTKSVRDESDREHNIALVQIGGDMFLRTVYADWYHDILVLDKHGALKSGKPELQSIAGPLCFSGDMISKNRLLPPTQAGDWIVIRDAGAYTFSMWSLFNSRAFPPIYGYDKDLSISLLKKGQLPDDAASFWE